MLCSVCLFILGESWATAGARNVRMYERDDDGRTHARRRVGGVECACKLAKQSACTSSSLARLRAADKAAVVWGREKHCD